MALTRARALVTGSKLTSSQSKHWNYGVLAPRPGRVLLDDQRAFTAIRSLRLKIRATARNRSTAYLTIATEQSCWVASQPQRAIPSLNQSTDSSRLTLSISSDESKSPKPHQNNASINLYKPPYKRSCLQIDVRRKPTRHARCVVVLYPGDLIIKCDQSSKFIHGSGAYRTSTECRYALSRRNDNQNAATAMASYLSFERRDCRVAFGGLDAIEIGTNWAPHVILMDISMPECNGYEASCCLAAGSTYEWNGHGRLSQR